MMVATGSETPTAAERRSVALPPRMRSGNLRRVSRGARLVDEVGKRRRIVHREISENFSVHLDPRELEPIHERVVVHVVLMCAGVDARDPQPAEVALLIFPVTVRVLPATLDGLLRG